MTGTVIIAILLAGWMALLLAAFVAHQRAAGRLEHWLEAHHLRLVRRRFWAFPSGPLAASVKRAEPVFRIEVIDEGGIVRNGWVRVGTGVGGFDGDGIDVVWTD